MKCESCNTRVAELEQSSSDGNPPYLLCTTCHQRLIDRALRPLEFFNLSAIHGNEYYLHDDFYDRLTGEATQSKVEVTDAKLFPFPQLDQVGENLHRLVDYACVECTISDRVIALLKQHNKDELLAYLKYKVRYNRAINDKAYKIAAEVLATAAGEWLRNEWENRRAQEVLIFAEALSRCLDFDEAFDKLTTEIEVSNDRQLLDNSVALIYFKDHRVLDWMEKISPRIVNVPSTWGAIAAASQFSWERAEAWLSLGRPLSLICLDALVFCTTKGENVHHPLWLRKDRPILLHQPGIDVFSNVLGGYLAQDKTRRTSAAIEQIQKNL